MSRPRNYFAAYFLFIGLLGVSAGLATQAQAPQGQVSPSSGPPPPPESPTNKNATIRTTVNLVQIDVQVLDRDGKPLKGLNANQFSVEEDGRPQKISTFDYYDVAAIETAASQGRAPLTIPIGSVAPPEKLQQQLQDRRLIVLFFDMTSLEPDQLIRSINAADKFVRTQMTPADLVGIIYFGNQLRVLADFTTDKDFLVYRRKGRGVIPLLAPF